MTLTNLAQISKEFIFVDDRWSGHNGIGRFSTEVIKRLEIPWTPLGGGMAPTSPRDVLNFKRLRLKPKQLVYNPGYNAGITRARQLLNIHDLIHLQIKSERSFAKSFYYRIFVRRSARRAGVVMTDSTASANAIKRWIGTTQVAVVVVGCGRSPEFSLNGVAAYFNRPTFLYVGNLSKPHKNFDPILAAILLRPEYDLLIVTSDSQLALSKVRAMCLEERVTVLSNVSDERLAELYRGASGLLQPSLLEGFGLPTLESMSCGTRVAYWAGCESVSEICDGTGLAVKSSSHPEGWAIAMDGLADLKAMKGQLLMSQAWSDRYDWDLVARKVNEVLVKYARALKKTHI